MKKVTKVVNCRKEPYDVFIGRPSKFGNPFKTGSRSEKIRKYKEWILTQSELLEEIYKLDGKTLGCFCKPLPCHGDIIVFLIEAHKNKKNLDNFI